jgi:hypothetical protein
MDKNINKQLVQIRDVPYIYLDFNLLYGDIEEVAKNILGIKDRLKEACDIIQKSVYCTPFEEYAKIEMGIKYGYDGDKDLEITVYRWETDEELQKRLDLDKKRSESAKLAAKNRKEAQEKRERTLLENLKKKYE